MYAENLQRLAASPNQTKYDQRETEPGITKAPLILGLNPRRSLGVPYCMTTDIMHLAGNLSNLLIALWRGTIDCDNSDNIDTWDWAIFLDNAAWERYGASVYGAGPHLPGALGTRPHKIAEKLPSGYKTWEFQLHTFGLGPVLLYDISPDRYFANYYKLVCGFQIMYRENRIHFIRPCVHQVVHPISETIRKGPPISYAQWTMERTIGNLGQEIQQPSNPYANLAQEGVRRCRVNSLLAAIPELRVSSHQRHPDTAVDLVMGSLSCRNATGILFIPLLPRQKHIRDVFQNLLHLSGASSNGLAYD